MIRVLLGHIGSTDPVQSMGYPTATGAAIQTDGVLRVYTGARCIVQYPRVDSCGWWEEQSPTTGHGELFGVQTGGEHGSRRRVSSRTAGRAR